MFIPRPFLRLHSALDETKQFSEAIQAAATLTKEEDTLIVVTADHAHTMTMAGYASRGNNIFKFAGHDSDHKPYMTLTYANGEGTDKIGQDLSNATTGRSTRR